MLPATMPTFANERESASPAPARRARPRPGVRLALVLVVIAIGVAAMPRWFYRGDPRAVRFGTAQLLERGSFGVPYAERERVPPFLIQFKGMMLFENDERARFYSKGRLLNSLLVVPPMALERLVAGPLELHPHSESLLLLLNAYNVLVSAVIALALFWLARRYTRRDALAVAATLAALFGSYVWYYLRAQASEIFQIALLLGFVVGLLAWHDARGAGRPAHGRFAAAAACGLLLTQLKPYYGLVFPLAWLAGLAAAPPGQRLRGAAREALRFGVPAAMAAAWVLVENDLFFGGPLRFGYDQFEQAGARVDRFAPAILLESIPAFLFRPDRSLLLHMPLVLLVPFSVPALWRRHRFDLCLAGLLTAAFLLLVGSYSNWPGDWCHGPRYLVFLAPFLGMLSVPALDRLADGLARRRVWAALAAALVVAALAASTWLETRVNGLEFHARYEAQHRYRRFEDERIDRWFRTAHSGVIAAALMSLRAGGPFPPSRWALAADPANAPAVAAAERSLRGHFVLLPNYYWAYWAASGSD